MSYATNEAPTPLFTDAILLGRGDQESIERAEFLANHLGYLAVDATIICSGNTGWEQRFNGEVDTQSEGARMHDRIVRYTAE
jgi:hypothetical protein